MIKRILATLFLGAAACDAAEVDDNVDNAVYADRHALELNDDDDSFRVTPEPVTEESTPAADEGLDDLAASIKTEAGCWVVLEWCDQPGPWGPKCTIKNCTFDEGWDACMSLIDKTCG